MCCLRIQTEDMYCAAGMWHSSTGYYSEEHTDESANHETPPGGSSGFFAYPCNGVTKEQHADCTVSKDEICSVTLSKSRAFQM